jgi:hypothetical protein
MFYLPDYFSAAATSFGLMLLLQMGYVVLQQVSSHFSLMAHHSMILALCISVC